MAEYRYEWDVTLSGCGPNRETAWRDMLDGLDPSDWTETEVITREINDSEMYPDAPPDETPIKKRPQDGSWLIWSNEHRMWWGAGRCGYFKLRSKAGRYSFDEAVRIVTEGNQFRHPAEDPQEMMIPDTGDSNG